MTQDEQLDRKYIAPIDPFRSAYDQLRPVERRFVDAYVYETAQSAIKAGKRVADHLRTYRPPGVIATEFLSRPLVCAAIRDKCDAISREADVSIIRVLQEIKSLAYSSMKHYVKVSEKGDWDFTLEELTDEQWAAVKSIKIGQNQWGPTKAIELHAKQPAIDMLAKFLGLDQSGIPDPKIIDLNPNVMEAAALYAAKLEEDE